MNTFKHWIAGQKSHSLFMALLLLVASPHGLAQSDDAFKEYRDMLGDDNPAVFVSEEGAELWLEPNGPNNVSLEACDLGQGPGVTAGAYARMPRYFPDTNMVMDLEARLLHCMVELQGRSKPLARKLYSQTGDMNTELEALSTFIAEESRGVTLGLPQEHPAEREAYNLGEQLIFRRAGPYDFSCASCHRQNGKRIRLQRLSNVTDPKGAGFAYSGWPAYRISQGLVRTMGWRLQNCARQQRLPQLQPGSKAIIALQVYLGVTATGTAMSAPGIKR